MYPTIDLHLSASFQSILSKYRYKPAYVLLPSLRYRLNIIFYLSYQDQYFDIVTSIVVRVIVSFSCLNITHTKYVLFKCKRIPLFYMSFVNHVKNEENSFTSIHISNIFDFLLFLVMPLGNITSMRQFMKCETDGVA